MNYVAQKNDCDLSFPTIATVNGQTLHNHYYGNRVKPGDLFLIDAVPRCRRAMRETCRQLSPPAPPSRLASVRLEIQKCHAPGVGEGLCARASPTWRCTTLSARVMVEGLKDLGLMKGNRPKTLCARVAHALFYPHGLGHMMGLTCTIWRTWAKCG